MRRKPAAPSPLDRLLTEAAQQAASLAVRAWLTALLQHGERASSSDRQKATRPEVAR
jgi:hypothetical protein